MNHRVSRDKLDAALNNLEDGDDVPLDVLVMVYYFYHNNDVDFDNGLGFFDQLHKKLSLYFELGWDVEGIKSILRQANNPIEEYYNILNQMLTPEMIAVYGV